MWLQEVNLMKPQPQFVMCVCVRERESSTCLAQSISLTPPVVPTELSRSAVHQSNQWLLVKQSCDLIDSR